MTDPFAAPFAAPAPGGPVPPPAPAWPELPPAPQPAYGQAYGPAYGPAYGQPAWQPGYGAAPWGPARQNGLGTAAMVVGILSIVLCWTVVPAVILGILGLVFGGVGRARVKRHTADNHGQALAGMITGGVGLALTALCLTGYIVGGTWSYQNCLDNAQTTAETAACDG